MAGPPPTSLCASTGDCISVSAVCSVLSLTPSSFSFSTCASLILRGMHECKGAQLAFEREHPCADLQGKAWMTASIQEHGRARPVALLASKEVVEYDIPRAHPRMYMACSKLQAQHA